MATLPTDSDSGHDEGGWLLNHTRRSIFRVGARLPPPTTDETEINRAAHPERGVPPCFQLHLPPSPPSYGGDVDLAEYRRLVCIYIPDGASERVIGLSNPGPGQYTFARFTTELIQSSIIVTVSSRPSRVDGGLLFRAPGMAMSGRDPAGLAFRVLLRLQPDLQLDRTTPSQPPDGDASTEADDAEE
uniref:Velvet domain-containing protein n=1 Tax=Pseudopestalotiopsis camelliae-sinensis polymycovirus 1 TaxID=3367397 RepID=A0AB74UH52_9VIRU